MRPRSSSSQYENIQIIKRRAALSDPDLIAFHAMVRDLRAEFDASDPYTNIGLVVSPIMENANVQVNKENVTELDKVYPS